MKPELVVPDLLAAMTADALFAGKPEGCAAPGATQPVESVFGLGRWFKRAPRPSAPVKPQAPRQTLDDDWVGGWYARARLLQTAAFANADRAASSTDAPDDKDEVSTKVITQVRDLS